METGLTEAFAQARGPARAKALCLHARAALAVGRHEAALHALRRVQRMRGQDAAPLALAAADALLRLERYAEALECVGRALKRSAHDSDVEARLRLVRGEALWRLGRVAAGEAEVQRGVSLAQAALTRARGGEAFALLCWKAQCVDESLAHLAQARRLYEGAHALDGLVRVLERECAVLWDAGREREALVKAMRRRELAAATTRFDALARAHHDAAALLVALGRWDEARAELELARDFFRRISDPREITLVGLTAARLDLARGDQAAARQALEAVRAAHAKEVGDTHARGEALLLWSDLELDAGAPARADEAAAQALQVFVRGRDARGAARARLRRVHALLALERTPLALHEARRAVKAAESSAGLQPVAALTLGRALLRAGRAEAEPVFASLSRQAGEHPALAEAARLGRLAASGAGASDEPQLRAALQRLVTLGDRRLLAFCLQDLGRGPWQRLAREFVPADPPRAGAPAQDSASGPSAEPPAFPGIIGRSEAMQGLFAQLASVAVSEANVHIHGETGAGKERIARALHEHSRRRRGPFVALNASSLGDELFEAELFGHTRGAFTGAVTDRPGLVAEAEGGTLFIDEVADLSLRAQAKLLRFVQEREYRRVGEPHLRRADVRVLSAANRELGELVAAGRFREDLLYRLHVVVLRLPSLRERLEDVLPLARHFLRQAAERDGRTCPTLDAEAAELLRAHAWPGNIRELENEMSRAVAFASGGRIGPEQLSPRLRVPAARAPLPLKEAQARWEREFVAEALLVHGGSRVRTAAALGITRQALLEKSKRLGL